jgi:hypothetical protein
LIFMSIAFTLVEEFHYVLIVSEDFDAILCLVLPILGFVICLWGLLEKDK